MIERNYQGWDVKILSQMGAPLDNEEFKARYMLARDIWRRLHQNDADMRQETLHYLVLHWELDHPPQPAEAPAPTEASAVKPKREKAVA